MTTTYTTTAKIRDDSGFKGNTYIIDGSIDTQRLRAFARINSYVGVRYRIPTLADANFTDSPAAQLLESLEILLGGALLLIQEYGPEGRDTDKDGYRRQSEAVKLLEEIRDGKASLFGNDGNLLPEVLAGNKQSGRLRGYVPDEPGRFSVDDKF